MTDKQQVSIEAMNKTICGFMGLEIDSRDGKILVVTRYADKIVSYHGCFYHSSWSELMPVICKIQKLGFEVVINAEGEKGLNQTFCYCDVIKKGNDGDKYIVDGCSEKKNIDAVFNSVYQFIIWLNKINDNGK